MKLNRPAILTSISLLTLGGLYYGFFRPVSEVADLKLARHEPKAPSVLIRPAENAGLTTRSFPKKQAPESIESKSADAGILADPQESPNKRVATSTAPEVLANVANRQTNHPTLTLTQPVADRADKPARPPVGIRLASDVRLPAAALPNDLILNPITQEALQHIIDEFYQAVAATVSTPGSGEGSIPVGNAGKISEDSTDSVQSMGTRAVKGKSANAPADSTQPAGMPMVEENGEQTVMIHNSPAVDGARMRADLRFKALFGHAAYNRMTMNALLESRLSPVRTEP